MGKAKINSNAIWRKEMKPQISLDKFDLEAEREGAALYESKSNGLASTFKPKKKRQIMSLLTSSNANKVFNSRVGCRYISK